MQADTHTLGQLLTISALLAATIQDVEFIKRRNAVRQLAALREESAEVGLRALVRVFLADASDTHDRRYLPEQERRERD